MNNPKRLVIATVLFAVCIPVIFGFYGITGEDSSEVILAKMIQAVPFGEGILKAIMLPISDTMSNYETFSDWLNAQEFSFMQHLAMEAGKLIFSSAVLMVIEKIASGRIRGNGSFLDNVADFIFVTLAVLGSCWLTDLLIEFMDTVAFADLTGNLRNAMTYLYSGILGTGGIMLMVIASVIVVDAVLSVLLNCFKMITTYTGIICVMAYYNQTNSLLLPGVAFAVWFVLIVGLHKAGQGVKGIV